MEKIKLIFLIIIFIAVLIFAKELLEDKNNLIIDEEPVNNIIQNSVEEKEEEIENMESSVLEVNNESFEAEVLKESKTVLVDFYADWCGPCKALSPVVETVAKENSDLKVVRVNVDDSEKLAVDYGIMSIPTLVVIKNGEEAKRSVGLISKSEVEELVK